MASYHQLPTCLKFSGSAHLAVAASWMAGLRRRTKTVVFLKVRTLPCFVANLATGIDSHLSFVRLQNIDPQNLEREAAHPRNKHGTQKRFKLGSPQYNGSYSFTYHFHLFSLLTLINHDHKLKFSAFFEAAPTRLFCGFGGTTPRPAGEPKLPPEDLWQIHGFPIFDLPQGNCNRGIKSPLHR